MLRNTFTANDKYPFPDCENLSSPIQMHLSSKPKTFSDFFVQFLESKSNFKHFEKKMIVIATSFRKLQSVKDLVRPLSKKHRLRTPFDSQHVKGYQILLKSAWENFHHIFSSLWEFRNLDHPDFRNISCSDMLNLRGVS